MKKYLVGLAVLLVVGAGCQSDDTPLSPGDLGDANFLEFSEQFEAMDEGVGIMAEMTFSVIDNVLTPAAPGVADLAAEFSLELVWDAESESWIGTLGYEDAELGLAFSAVNTVQFFQGSDAVQYPDEELLTSVTSSVIMSATGENINISATQDLVVDVPAEGSDVVVLNGSGGFNVDLIFEEEGEGGITTCDINQEFSTTLTNVAIYDGETPSACDGPVGGSVRFSGASSAECTGAVTASSNAAWTVTRTWDGNGDAVTTFISGGNIWTVEEPCLQ